VEAKSFDQVRKWHLARARVWMALVVAHGAQADPWQLARARVGMVLPMGNMLFCERQFKGNAFFLLGFPSNLKPLEPLWNMADGLGSPRIVGNLLIS
jgi:hypothetical protein